MQVLGIERRQRQAVREQLRDQPLFCECSDAELDVIDGLLTEVPTQPDDVVLAEGATDRQFMIVVDGWLQVSRAGGQVGLLGPGEFVGEVAMLHGGPRSATVKALTPGTVWVVGQAEFARLTRIPALAARLRAVAEERRQANRAATAPLVTAGGRPPRRRQPVAVALPQPIRRRRRWLRRTVVTSVAVLAVTATVGAWMVANRNKTTQATLQDALAELQSDGSSPLDLAAPAVAPTDAAPAPAGVAAAPAPPSEASGAPMPASPAHRAEAGVAPTPAATAAARFAPPTPGVYTYATSGREEISILGTHHEYPEETYSIVRRGDGCAWTAEHRVIAEHVDHFARCSADGQFLNLGDASDVEFFSQRDGISYVCDPPALVVGASDTPGTSRTSTCTSDAGDKSRMTSTYVGREAVNVGGTTVEADHVSFDIVVEGRADGGAHADFWLHPETGLTLRLVRDVDTLGEAAFGDVRYTEHAEFTLTSLTPRSA